MKRLAVVLAAVGLVVMATGCEPKMTITARDKEHSQTECYVMHVVGNVSPVNATPKVVLQQTSGGKWVDVKGWPSEESAYTTLTPTPRTANVSKSTGGYSIPYYINWTGPKHLRVRSDGGGGVSPGFYVNITGWDC